MLKDNNFQTAAKFLCVLSRAEIESSSESDVSNQRKDIEEKYLEYEVKVYIF